MTGMRETTIGLLTFRFDEEAGETTIVWGESTLGGYVATVQMTDEQWEHFVREATGTVVAVEGPVAVSDTGPIDAVVARALRQAGVRVGVTLLGPVDVEGAVTLHLPMRATFAAELLQFLGQRGFQFATGEEAA